MSTTKKNPYYKTHIGEYALHPETQMMSYGYDPFLSEGALKPPVFHTSTFVFETAQDGKSFFELAYGKRQKNQDEEVGLIYSRINNPNLEVLEDRLTLWDGAEKALSFSSGMAAISTSLFAYVRPGDQVFYSAPLYGGTEYLIRNILPEFGANGVEFTSWNEEFSLEKQVEAHQGQGRISVIFVETPANPTNCLVDLEQCAHIADELEKSTGHRPIIMVDNTFLGPLWQRPLDFGADLVLYSLTKYIGGHSDLVAGGAVGSEAILAPIQGFRTILGTMCDPQTGWMILRSLETLHVRMTRSNENAKKIAQMLHEHPLVSQVGHLDLMDPNEPAYRIYKKQCLAAGSTFSFEIKGGEAEAFKVLDSLKVIKLAVSLGGTESLMEHPYSMTHSDVPDVVKERLGITCSLLRISVGIEHPDDLIEDLKAALATLTS
jgi:methionine-gamma-lyase